MLTRHARISSGRRKLSSRGVDSADASSDGRAAPAGTSHRRRSGSGPALAVCARRAARHAGSSCRGHGPSRTRSVRASRRPRLAVLTVARLGARRRLARRAAPHGRLRDAPRVALQPGRDGLARLLERPLRSGARADAAARLVVPTERLLRPGVASRQGARRVALVGLAPVVSRWRSRHRLVLTRWQWQTTSPAALSFSPQNTAPCAAW